jgi:hypothetical protein
MADGDAEETPQDGMGGLPGGGGGGAFGSGGGVKEALDVSMLHPVGTLALVTRLTQTPRGVQLLLLGQKRVQVSEREREGWVLWGRWRW